MIFYFVSSTILAIVAMKVILIPIILKINEQVKNDKH